MLYYLKNAYDWAMACHHVAALVALGGRGLYRATAGHWMLLDAREADPETLNGLNWAMPFPAEVEELAGLSECTRHAQAANHHWYRHAYRLARRVQAFDAIADKLRRVIVGRHL